MAFEDYGITPELIDSLIEYGLIEPTDALALYQSKMAQREKETPQPEPLIHGRQMGYTPSPLAFGAATMKQISGGQDTRNLMDIMAHNLRRRGQLTGPYARWALEQQAKRQQQQPNQETFVEPPEVM